MKRMAVLMTVHNRRETTLRCLQLLQNQNVDVNEFSVDVYLTNDGCTDGTPEAIREKFPCVHIINGDGNLYWNRGLYAAWCEAEKFDYDYYLWLNDDTLLYDSALGQILICSQKQGDFSIVVGSVCAIGNQSVITYGGISQQENPIQNVSEFTSCELMNGNFVLIPRCVYQKIGKNNPIYHHAIGDYDYAWRAKKNEIDVVVAQGIMGECDKRNQLWKDAGQSFRVRHSDFWKFTGANPFDVFRFNKISKGIFGASLYFLSGYLHMVFPRLYNRFIK